MYREVRGGGSAADAAGADEESARPFFWPDEHAVRAVAAHLRAGQALRTSWRTRGAGRWTARAVGRSLLLFLIVTRQ